MNGRWITKKSSIIILIALCVLAGLMVRWWDDSRKTGSRFTAIKTTQFYALAVQSWASDFEHKKKDLPSPYPRSFDDLSKYGYIEREFIDDLNRDLKVTFFPPPADVQAEFVLIQAEALTSVWVVRLHDQRINSDGDYLVPLREELRNEEESGVSSSR